MLGVSNTNVTVVEAEANVSLPQAKAFFSMGLRSQRVNRLLDSKETGMYT